MAGKSPKINKISRFQAAGLVFLEEIELGLKINLPEELRSLLLESDGIEGEFGLGLIWNCRRIIEDNLKFRNSSDFLDLYMPFEPLLFFADTGTGDQFAYAILNNHIRRHDIYIWNHEDDSRIWAAPSLEKYLEWWLTGKIKY